MTINKITGELCKTARPLWDEVFHEDSIQFTDYYFDNKAEKNIGYTLGEVPYEAMMFRTPYTLQIGKVKKEISYIVGVATKKECRHRGYMRKLLMYSFQEMYREKNPFTFLMPANPSIYEPFDFRYVYERDVWTLKEQEKMEDFLEALTLEGNKEYETDRVLNGLYSVRRLQKHIPEIPIMEQLVEFSNQYLKEHYNIYVFRDAAYYEMQLKESEAQNGDIYVWFEQGKIKAFFLYAREEGEVFVQEVIEAKEGILDFLQKSENKKPVIMARIIHLEEMLKLICSKEHREIILQVEDDLIPENAGVYRWEIMPQGSQIGKISSEMILGECHAANLKEQKIPLISMHIRELAPKILKGVFLNEIV